MASVLFHGRWWEWRRFPGDVVQSFVKLKSVLSEVATTHSRLPFLHAAKLLRRRVHLLSTSLIFLLAGNQDQQ